MAPEHTSHMRPARVVTCACVGHNCSITMRSTFVLEQAPKTFHSGEDVDFFKIIVFS